MAIAITLNTDTLVINAAVATVPNEITTISADRIKSVRIAPLTFSFSNFAKSTSIASRSALASSAVFAFLM
jgi:hypothetical protein